MEKNDDILSNVSKNYPNSFVVGFAAETENIEENSRKKLTEKNLNMIMKYKNKLYIYLVYQMIKKK